LAGVLSKGSQRGQSYATRYYPDPYEIFSSDFVVRDIGKAVG